MFVTSKSRAALLPNKVPEVTLTFWAVKILSTTVGETCADFLAVRAGLGATTTSLIMATLLAAALAFQIRATRYIPWNYWLTVVLISIFGTGVTDFLTDKMQVSLYVSTAVFSAMLAAIFFSWWLVERTLSIHTIVTRRREVFYWTAILFTFALGTASGDLATEALGLGFQNGVLICAALIGASYFAYVFRANAVLTFWIAYILTRPLGASLGDLLSQSPKYGRRGFGAFSTSIVFLTVILALVAWMTFERSSEPRASAPRNDWPRRHDDPPKENSHEKLRRRSRRYSDADDNRLVDIDVRPRDFDRGSCVPTRRFDGVPEDRR